MDELTAGDNTFEFELYHDNAVKRVEIRLIDRALPVDQLVEEATRP